MKFNNRDAGKQLDSKVRYSAFKLKELDKSEEPKALLYVDSMLNWSDHEGEDEEKGVAQVYGMIAGDDDDTVGDASGDVSDAAAEFALMGLSSQRSKASDKSSDSETTGFASCVSSVKSSSLKTKDQLASASTNIPSFVPRAAYVPAGSRNPPASVYAGSAFPAGSRNRPTSRLPACRPIFCWFGAKSCCKTSRPDQQAIKFSTFRRPGCYNQLYNGCGKYGEQLLRPQQNKVLFTDTECLVLTKEFQLPENSQVVLRVPRRHNLYSFNLTKIQPERDITCLLAKASSDEYVVPTGKDNVIVSAGRSKVIPAGRTILVLAVNKSPTHYPCDFARTFRVMLFSIYSDEWKSFQSQHQIALRGSKTLSWKPCLGDSLNLPDHRYKRWCCSLIPAESDSLPHAHAQTTKTYYKHQDSRIKKAQELKTKTSVNSDINDPTSETKLRGDF
ncbi:hypothetical protein Tco_0402167 [Tanacetum coccineum]